MEGILNDTTHTKFPIIQNPTASMNLAASFPREGESRFLADM